MSQLLRKLQYKSGGPILVSHAPAELQPVLDEMREAAKIVTRPGGGKRYPLVLTFVRTCSELAAAAPKAVARVEDDGLLWFAYPKKSSKRYDSDIGREQGWQPLGDLGYEGVRMVAIDDDWSALRLRRVEHIAKLRRDPTRAMSASGKRRAGR